MLIKSIKIENFRQYKGTNYIEFSSDEEKPITVLLGQNTGGKTTFVRAFAWCLYGGEADQIGFSKGSHLLNDELYLELEP